MEKNRQGVESSSSRMRKMTQMFVLVARVSVMQVHLSFNDISSEACDILFAS
jgi:hypothetical protein